MRKAVIVVDDIVSDRQSVFAARLRRQYAARLLDTLGIAGQQAFHLAFFVTAYVTWRLARRVRLLDAPVWWLIALIVAIGGGSMLFHSLATPWAMAADVLPILLFQPWTEVWVEGVAFNFVSAGVTATLLYLARHRLGARARAAVGAPARQPVRRRQRRRQHRRPCAARRSAPA